MTSFRVSCGAGRAVTMSNSAWEHIQEWHNEVQAQAVRATVEAPDFVQCSSIEPHARIYFRRDADPDPRWQGYNCAVVVKFDPAISKGWVSTAIYTKKNKWGTGDVDYDTRPTS